MSAAGSMWSVIMGGSVFKREDGKKEVEDAEDESHCGALEQISAGKYLFRAYCGFWGVISEQRGHGGVKRLQVD